MEAALRDAAIILGLIFGSAMLAVACLKYYKHGLFALGGSVLTVFGVLLLGLSIWTTVDIKVSPQGQIEARFEKTVEMAVEKVEQTTQKFQREIITDLLEAQIPRLRESFRIARNLLEASGKIDFSNANDVVDFLLNRDPQNGHALYYAGEIKRIQNTQRFTVKSCPRSLLGKEAVTLDTYRQDFYRYLEVEKTLPSSQRHGETGSEICYQTPKGYCSQRTGWIHHLLGNDLYQEAMVATDSRIRFARLSQAKEHAALAHEYYLPNGFEQCIPTPDLQTYIEERLRAASRPKSG